MTGLEARLTARFRAYDGLGMLRATTPEDLPAARWLAAEAGGAQLMPVAMPHLAVQRAEAAWQGGSVQGLPLFDGGLTGAEGITGRLGTEIGFLELDPAAASLKQMPFERLRRETRHRALVVAARTATDGLAPLNAHNFLTPFGPPVLQVAGRDAAGLATLAAAGTLLRITLTAERQAGVSANVMADLPGGAGAPLVVMTPRTSWWTSLGERAGGILAWLEALAALRQGGALGRQVHFVASCGHELGHLGLAAWLDARPGLVAQAGLFLHLGANLGAAGTGRLILRSNLPEMTARATAALVAAGYPAEAIVLAAGETANGEAHDILARGGRFLSLIGTNPRFHAPEDRWPHGVDVDRAAAIARAVTALAIELAAA